MEGEHENSRISTGPWSDFDLQWCDIPSWLLWSSRGPVNLQWEKRRGRNFVRASFGFQNTKFCLLHLTFITLDYGNSPMKMKPSSHVSDANLLRIWTVWQNACVLHSFTVICRVGSHFSVQNPCWKDQFFQKASEFARIHGLPRVYVSCNSGARVGLVEELKPLFKVKWFLGSWTHGLNSKSFLITFHYFWSIGY